MTIQQIAGCCDCATGTHPCIVSICPNVQPFDVIVCDDCGEETERELEQFAARAANTQKSEINNSKAENGAENV